MLLHALLSGIPLSHSVSQIPGRIRGRPNDRSNLSSDHTACGKCWANTVGDWFRFMSNAVIADVEALNGDTDKARPLRREKNQAPASPRDEPHQSEPHSPIFPGEAHKGCSRYRKELGHGACLALRESDGRIGKLATIQILRQIWNEPSLVSIRKGWPI
jgi:hypothetical protein